MSALNVNGNFGNSPHHFELIDKDGATVMLGDQPFYFTSAVKAAEYARLRWPDQEQDEERTGRGWDVQVVGCDDPPKAWLDAKVEIDEGWL